MRFYDSDKFPFPSTGKAFPNLTIEHAVAGIECQFPFPSTGKAFPNQAFLHVTPKQERLVSIPFHREGISER